MILFLSSLCNIPIQYRPMCETRLSLFKTVVCLLSFISPSSTIKPQPIPHPHRTPPPPNPFQPSPPPPHTPTRPLNIVLNVKTTYSVLSHKCSITQRVGIICSPFRVFQASKGQLSMLYWYCRPEVTNGLHISGYNAPRHSQPLLMSVGSFRFSYRRLVLANNIGFQNHKHAIPTGYLSLVIIRIDLTDSNNERE